MLRPDVIDLREFYGNRLGGMARRVIRQRLRETWPNVAGQRVLGFGYAIPYLEAFREEAERVVAVMPAQQGVVHWPRQGPNMVCLADEYELPLPDSSIDRVLMVHGLEGCELVRQMLREVWRVLTSSGTLLVVAPNRRGLWARVESTPFGHGNPYSQPQLFRLLRDTMFSPIRSMGSLYMPPSRRRFIVRGATAWETVGNRLWPTFSGVVLVEAGKQIYAVTADRGRKRARIKVPDLIPSGLSS